MKTIDFDLLNLSSHSAFLDLGCGEGRHAIALAFEEKVSSLLAIDINFEDLSTAQAKEKETTELFPQQTNIQWLQGDGLKLPFGDLSIDTAVCSEVLEHIDVYEDMLQEITRVLKPNACLAISVPRSWPERFCWWLSTEYHQVPGGHIRIFKQHLLQNQIERLGFTHYKTHGAHALHVPYWWLKCFFWQTQEDNLLIRWYHRFLVWDMMENPKFTHFLEKCLNPFMGKSTVLYFRKNP